jgi:hypothetical protein
MKSSTKTKSFNQSFQALVEKANTLNITIPHKAFTKCPTSGDTDIESGLIQSRLGLSILDGMSVENQIFIRKIIRFADEEVAWHTIEYLEAGSFDFIDHIQCGQTKSLCTDYLKILTGSLVDFEDSLNGETLCQHKGTTLAIIRPIHFEPTEGGDIHLFEKAMFKITANSTSKEICDSFNSLPNLKNCTIDTEPYQYETHPIFTTLKSVVHSLKRSLSKEGLDLKLGHAQELLAAFFGLYNWNELKALEKKSYHKSIRPVIFVGTINGKLIHKYYIDLARGLSENCQTLGSGKIIDINLDFFHTSFTKSNCISKSILISDIPSPYIHKDCSMVKYVSEVPPLDLLS